ALRFAEGKRAKTDRLDAGLIARFALMMDDAARPIPNAKAYEIKALSTRRRQLVEMAAAEKVRLKQALDAVVATSCRQMIALLVAERGRVGAQLAAELAAVDGGAECDALLQSIPGIGPATAMALRADLPELGQLDRKAVAHLAGLARHPNQSHTRTGQAHSGGDRPCARAALYMAAISADKGFIAECHAMRTAGKPAKVALIAVARKLVVAANAIVKFGQPWQKPA
ncbi:MAG: transposase, partial [Sandarakinorhabdus sp.]|nr:transposase [Sandarakinorhabdus sp.]